MHSAKHLLSLQSKRRGLPQVIDLSTKHKLCLGLIGLTSLPSEPSAFLLGFPSAKRSLLSLVTFLIVKYTIFLKNNVDISFFERGSEPKPHEEAQLRALCVAQQ